MKGLSHVQASSSDHSAPPLSVAVITMNEEANLARCLQSVVGLAREIVVIDSGSTDATLEIARQYGARIEVRAWPGHVKQKNHALAQCHEPWVLSLDADEALSPELRQAIVDLFAQGEPAHAGYLVNRRTFYLGDWIWHAWYPEWRLRLVQRTQAQWIGTDPHDLLSVAGTTARLRGDLLHYSYRDLEDHLLRTIKYAHIGATEILRKGGRFQGHKLLLSPWSRLLRSLVLKQAWRDGWRGWVIAFSSMLSSFAKYAFVLEHELKRRTKIRKPDES